MTYSELKRLLKKHHCQLVREGANHEIWYSPKTNLTFTVARHNRQEIPKGTIKSIKKSAGIE